MTILLSLLAGALIGLYLLGGWASVLGALLGALVVVVPYVVYGMRRIR